MTQATRFLFDECLGRPVVERQIKDSLRLYGSDAELAHLFSKFPMGAKDTEWIPAIAQEGGWIVVTADRGKHSKKDEKLPYICREFGVSHVMLSSGLHRRTMYYKYLAISSCWSALLDVGSHPPGTGFSLGMHGDKKFRFRKTMDPIADNPEVNHQGTLFDLNPPPDEAAD